jgi:hypothetical protein
MNASSRKPSSPSFNGGGRACTTKLIVRHEGHPILSGSPCMISHRKICLGAHLVKGSHRDGVSRWCGVCLFQGFERSRSELLLSIAGLCATSLGNYALFTTFHCGRKGQTTSTSVSSHFEFSTPHRRFCSLQSFLSFYWDFCLCVSGGNSASWVVRAFLSFT